MISTGQTSVRAFNHAARCTGRTSIALCKTQRTKMADIKDPVFKWSNWMKASIATTIKLEYTLRWNTVQPLSFYTGTHFTRLEIREVEGKKMGQHRDWSSLAAPLFTKTKVMNMKSVIQALPSTAMVGYSNSNVPTLLDHLPLKKRPRTYRQSEHKI